MPSKNKILISHKEKHSDCKKATEKDNKKNDNLKLPSQSVSPLSAEALVAAFIMCDTENGNDGNDNQI